MMVLTPQALARRAAAPALLLSLLLGACADSATSPDGAPLRAVATEQVEVWWPTEGARLTGTHVFKALLPGWDLKDYRLYWRVDGGQLNKMGDSYEGGAHKRATVGLDSWTWRGEGPYVVTFVATDKRGRTTLGERSVTIYVGDAPPSTLEVTQPSEGEWLSGTHTFAARIVERSADGYVMYWRVDGGQLNAMADAADGSGDVAQVDVSTWTWRGTGPYIVDFVAMDGDVRLAEKTVSIYVGTPPAAVATVEVTPSTLSLDVGATAQLQAIPRDAGGNALTGRSVTWTSSDASLATVDASGLVTGVAAGVAVVTATSEGISGSSAVTVESPPPPPPSVSPFADATFYIDPYSNARKTADQWHSSRPADALQMEKIAAQPQADWFGEWSGDIRAAVDARVGTITAAGALPVLVAYMIPGRDCNGYSAGGSSTADAYRTWIQAFAAGIGTRRAAVVLEPDALAALDCLPAADQQSRMELLAFAVQTLKSQGSTAVYIDAGHARWKAADVMAGRLGQAGIAYADGFSLNVSNFVGNAESKAYGEAISTALGGGVRFIIDSSRNGLGPTADGQWCNPDGRALGTNPTAATTHALLDAYFWIKRPGESDGSCNGGPSAGSWWAEYALGLAERQTTDMSIASITVANAR